MQEGGGHSGPYNGVRQPLFKMAANENAITRPIFELGILPLHKNGVEFDQDYNGIQ